MKNECIIIAHVSVDNRINTWVWVYSAWRTYHLIRLVELHLDPPQRRFLLLYIPIPSTYHISIPYLSITSPAVFQLEQNQGIRHTSPSLLRIPVELLPHAAQYLLQVLLVRIKQRGR